MRMMNYLLIFFIGNDVILVYFYNNFFEIPYLNFCSRLISNLNYHDIFIDTTYELMNFWVNT